MLTVLPRTAAMSNSNVSAPISRLFPFPENSLVNGSFEGKQSYSHRKRQLTPWHPHSTPENYKDGIRPWQLPFVPLDVWDFHQNIIFSHLTFLLFQLFPPSPPSALRWVRTGVACCSRPGPWRSCRSPKPAKRKKMVCNYYITCVVLSSWLDIW